VIVRAIDERLVRLGHEADLSPVAVVQVEVGGRELEVVEALQPLFERRRLRAAVVRSDGWMLRRRGQTPSGLLDALRRHGYSTFLLEDDGTTRLRPLAAGDILPLAVAHIAAFCDLGPLPGSWCWGPPLTEDEVVGRMLRLCVDPHPPYREEAAWLLREAPPALAAHRALRVARTALREDPDEHVRAAAT